MEMYKSCNDIPVKNFAKILQGESNWLLKGTRCSELTSKQKTAIKSRCESIINEATSMMSGDINVYLFHHLKECNFLIRDIAVVDSILLFFLNNSMLNHESERPIEILKHYGFPYKYTEKTLFNDLVETAVTYEQVLIKYSDSKRHKSGVMDASDKLLERHYLELVKYLNDLMGFDLSFEQSTLTELLASLAIYNAKFKNKFKNRQNEYL